MGRAILVFFAFVNAGGSMYVYYCRPDAYWYLYGSIPLILLIFFALGFYRN